MSEHRSLTGASLHEPKGVESATLNTVYHANGVGGGTWVDPLTRIKNVNRFSLNDSITDISAVNSNTYFYAPFDSTINTIACILSGAITVANSILTIYRNGSPTLGALTVPFSGSGAGVKSVLTGLSLAVNAGDVIEVRSDGGSTDTQKAYITLKLTAL